MMASGTSSQRTEICLGPQFQLPHCSSVGIGRSFSMFAANKGMAFQPHGMRLVLRNINLQQRMEST